MLPRLLDHLRATAPPWPLEIIIADGGSTDDTVRLATRAGCRVTHASCGRALQFNAGAAIARGLHLYFLHADTLPPADWARYVTAPRAGCFSLRFAEQDSSWLLRFLSRASRLNLDAFRYGDQSLFVPATTFRAVGGYADQLRVFEDYELVRRLRHFQGGFEFRPGRAATTSARRYLEHGVLYTQTCFTLLYLAYRFGASQSKLTAFYRRAFRAG